MTRARVYAAPKNPDQFRAFAQGFDADLVPADSPVAKSASLHIVGGLQFGALEALQTIRRHALPYVFFDRAYFGGGPRTQWLRVVPGAYQHHWISQHGPQRFDALVRAGLAQLQPWRRGGRHIMVVPPSMAVQKLFGVPSDWAAQQVATIKAATDRPVIVSTKGDPRPLAERLADCWAVVTWSSNVAVEAICAGVPAFAGPESAAWPVSGELSRLAQDIEKPPRCEREAWAWGLAAGQFTIDEIRSGAARDAIQGAAWA